MDAKPEGSEEKKTDEEYPFHNMIRRMMLAGMGMLSYSHEEMEKFVDEMVKRGEVAQKGHETRMQKMRERREQFLRDRRGFTQKRVEKALDQLDVASKNDIADMNAKISALEKKIDELKKTAE